MAILIGELDFTVDINSIVYCDELPEEKKRLAKPLYDLPFFYRKAVLRRDAVLERRAKSDYYRQKNRAEKEKKEEKEYLKQLEIDIMEDEIKEAK